MILDAQVIAIEGAHGSGKTTAIYTIAGELKARGIHLGIVDDSARRNRFVEDFILHGIPMTSIAEVNLVCQQIAAETIAARHNDLILCDKTILNILAYSSLLVEDSTILTALRVFGSAYVSSYDNIFLLSEDFNVQEAGDSLRTRDSRLRPDTVHSAIRNLHQNWQIGYCRV
jgi:thymidylate kinase